MAPHGSDRVVVFLASWVDERSIARGEPRGVQQRQGKRHGPLRARALSAPFLAVGLLRSFESGQPPPRVRCRDRHGAILDRNPDSPSLLGPADGCCRANELDDAQPVPFVRSA